MLPTEARTDGSRELHADFRVVPLRSFPQIVEQRTDHEQVWSIDRRRQLRPIGDRFQQMPIDGETVIRVVLRPGSHARPLGE